MSLRDRLVDLDSRLLGAPGEEPNEALRRSGRYWWVGLALAAPFVVVSEVLSASGRPDAAIASLGLAILALFTPLGIALWVKRKTRDRQSEESP